MATPVVGPTSLADLQKGASTSGESGTDASSKPSWLNNDVYNPKHISEFFNKHLFSFVCAWHCSLTLGFSLPALLKPLVYTKNSSTPKTAFKRYQDTFTHLAEWHEGDIFNSTTKAYASLQGVRKFHAVVRFDMTRDLPGTTWISAYNMACVQAGFFAAISMHGDKFGLTGSDDSNENMAKYVAFWRCVGRQLGVADEFNLCSRDRPTVMSIVDQIINQVLLPDEAHPPPAYTPIADAYVGGLNLIFCNIPIISVKSSLAFSFWAGGYPQSRWPKLNFCDWVRFWMIRIVMLCVGALPFVGSVLSWATKRTLIGNYDSRGAIAGGWQQSGGDDRGGGGGTCSGDDGDNTTCLLKQDNAATRKNIGSPLCPVTGMRSRKGSSLPHGCAGGAMVGGVDLDVGILVDEKSEKKEEEETSLSPCCCCCRPKGGPTSLCVVLGLLFTFLFAVICSFGVGAVILGQHFLGVVHVSQ